MALGLGIAIFLIIWGVQRKRPTLVKSLNLLLCGGLLYGGASALYYGFTGAFMLNDTLETLQIITSVGGFALLWLGYDLLSKEFKKKGKR